MPQAMRRLIVLAVALLGVAGAVPAAEEESQRLELGAGIGLLARPYYAGSKQFRTTVLPVPYVSYHDERLEITRDGLVAKLFDTDRVRLGMSLSASLPANDNKHSARQGMPHLLPTFEAGPSLDWHLGDTDGPWNLKLPIRAVAAADLDEFHGIGWLAYPHLQFDRTRQIETWDVETAAGIGPLWGSREYHRYFYRVAPRYATAERPAYDPDGGYTGTRATGYLGLHRGPWHMGLGIAYDTLAGSVIRDSPLVETRHATVVGAGVFYTFWVWTRSSEDEAKQ